MDTSYIQVRHLMHTKLVHSHPLISPLHILQLRTDIDLYSVVSILIAWPSKTEKCSLFHQHKNVNPEQGMSKCQYNPKRVVYNDDLSI